MYVCDCSNRVTRPCGRPRRGRDGAAAPPLPTFKRRKLSYLELQLSLSLYIYIYTYVCVYIYI